MKRFIKYPFALALLSAGTLVHKSDARLILFDDAFFFDNSWVDDLMDFQRHSMEQFRSAAAEFGPSKEEREAFKAARERLAKIKHTLTEDDHKVTIQFSGFDALDKKDIKIVKKDNQWIGTIVTKDGRIEFVIAQNGIQVSRLVEIKKEDKDKKDRVSYTSSLAADVEYFKHLVDIGTTKAESVKDNTLTIVIQKQKEEVLPIP